MFEIYLSFTCKFSFWKSFLQQNFRNRRKEELHGISVAQPFLICQNINNFQIISRGKEERGGSHLPHFAKHVYYKYKTLNSSPIFHDNSGTACWLHIVFEINFQKTIQLTNNPIFKTLPYLQSYSEVCKKKMV